MTILFQCADDDGRMADSFCTALNKALPGQSVQIWPDVTSPECIDEAVVWLPPEDLFDKLTALTHIHLLAAGADQLLALPGLPPSASIHRLEDAGMGKQMAEYVLYGVLHAHRRFSEFAAGARAGEWRHQTEVLDAADFHIGILGAGVLGQQVATRLVDNGYAVSCWSRSPKALPDRVTGVSGPEGLRALVPTVNALVCLLPLTPATQGILNADLFAQLPKGSYLINPGRGGHLIEADLIPALDRGQLSGALLDVAVVEPMKADHPFRADPRITVTPHIAAPSPVGPSVAQVVANIVARREGRATTGQVDRSRGY